MPASKDIKSGMVTRAEGSLIVIVQNKDVSTDPEWDEFLEILIAKRPQFEQLKILVITKGGAPSGAQRKQLERALEGKPVRVAVVSDNMKTRFIVASIALFNREMSSFSNSEILGAYDHLMLTMDERRRAKQLVEDMRPLVKD